MVCDYYVCCSLKYKYLFQGEVYKRVIELQKVEGFVNANNKREYEQNMNEILNGTIADVKVEGEYVRVKYDILKFHDFNYQGNFIPTEFTEEEIEIYKRLDSFIEPGVKFGTVREKINHKNRELNREFNFENDVKILEVLYSRKITRFN